MRELRPLFREPEQFVERVLHQKKEGYQLAYLESEGEVCAVAGYRVLESLFSGKFLYVDDLVTSQCDRSRGFGGQLLDWLIERRAGTVAKISSSIPASRGSTLTGFISPSE